MTNAEKFTEVFGTDLKRQYSTLSKISKTWCDQEFVSKNPSKCTDAISRQAALRQAINAYKMAQENEFDFKDICEEYLNVLPPVTPQLKTGQWITTRTFMHDGEYYCNRCKCDAPNNEKWYYCPNCGAKMEVKDDT